MKKRTPQRGKETLFIQTTRPPVPRLFGIFSGMINRINDYNNAHSGFRNSPVRTHGNRILHSAAHKREVRAQRYCLHTAASTGPLCNRALDGPRSSIPQAGAWSNSKLLSPKDRLKLQYFHASAHSGQRENSAATSPPTFPEISQHAIVLCTDHAKGRGARRRPGSTDLTDT